MTSGDPHSSDHNDWIELCAQLEQLVVKGDHEQCRRMLNPLFPKKIPREWSAKLGEFCYRVNLPLLTLKILQPILFPENSFSFPASDKEKLVYATGLFKLGAISQSLKILETIDGKAEPEALFAKAGAYFFDWNYSAGISVLKEFITSDSISSYRLLVGKLNLAAAFVHIGDWDSASSLLGEISNECEIKSYHLLHGNCLELSAQIHLFQGNYDEALRILTSALAHLENQAGLYSMFVEKWMVICRLLKTSNVLSEEQRNLQKVRERAFQLRHWSTLRECDLFEAMSTSNENLFQKVVMGTPSEHYRQRARKLFGKKLISKGQYLWSVEKCPSHRTDLTPETSLIFDPVKTGLSSKPQLLNLFQVLARDFYQPCSLGMIFQGLYPDENFNPFSSPGRVLQLLRRLNSWFVEHQFPLHVEFKKSEFQLRASKAVFIVVQRGVSIESLTNKLSEIKAQFDNRDFSVPKLSQAMGISETTSRRIIQRALAAGKLIKIGQGKATTYRFKGREKPKKAA